MTVSFRLGYLFDDGLRRVGHAKQERQGGDAIPGDKYDVSCGRGCFRGNRGEGYAYIGRCQGRRIVDPIPDLQIRKKVWIISGQDRLMITMIAGTTEHWKDEILAALCSAMVSH